MNNHSIEVPTLRPAVGYAFDARLDQAANGANTLRGVDICAPGALAFEDIDGNSSVYDFSGLTAGIPYRFIMQIRKIVGNGSGSIGTDPVTQTTIALASLKPLR